MKFVSFSRVPARVLVALAFAFCSARAGAEDGTPRIRLVYDAPEGCPSRDELVEPIAARVGYRPISDRAEDGFAVRVTAQGDRFRATLDPLTPSVAGGTTAHGARTFVSRSCREVVESVALTLALYLDPVLGPRAPSARAAPPAPRPSQPVSAWREPDPFEKSASPAPPQAPSTAFFVSGAVGAAVDLAPSVTMGPRLGLGVRGATFAIGLEGRADLSLASVRAKGLDVDGSFAGASVVPCVHRSWAFACLEASAGRYEAVARGPDFTRSASTLFVMAGARLGAELRIDTRTRLTLHAFGAAPLTPVQWIVANEPIWTIAPVAFGVALGAQWSP